MKIIRLQAENIKKLTAIDITPTNPVITITGRNGAGKSSVLDCITMALCGGREIPAEPIKKGHDKASIVMDLGDYVVTRSFSKDNSYLRIEAKDGSKVSSPQKFLDGIVGSVSFDPLEFMNRDAKDQRKVLLELVGADLDQFDVQEKELREQRTLVGRNRDRADSLYKSLSYYKEVEGREEQDASTILKQVQAAQDHNARLDAAIRDNESIRDRAKQKRAQITDYEEQIAALQHKILTLSSEIEQDKQAYMARKTELDATERKDITEISASLQTIEETNRKVRENVKNREAYQSYRELADEYADLGKQIDACKQAKKDVLLGARIPVEGLEVTDDGLRYNEVLLDQCSDGEKLMISLRISMALNPTLRVLRIKDGSLLDSDNREILRQAVEAGDYQLWFESVAADGKIGILIEEGEIAAVDGQPVEKKEKRVAKPKEKAAAPNPDPVAEPQSTTSTAPEPEIPEDW